MMRATILHSQRGCPSQAKNILTKYSLLAYRSTVAVQRGDGGPWMYGMIIGYGTDGHNGRNYRIRVKKQDMQ